MHTSHLTPAPHYHSLPPLSTSYIRAVYLLQSMNLYRHIIITLSPNFKFHSWCTFHGFWPMYYNKNPPVSYSFTCLRGVNSLHGWLVHHQISFHNSYTCCFVHFTLPSQCLWVFSRDRWMALTLRSVLFGGMTLLDSKWESSDRTLGRPIPGIYQGQLDEARPVFSSFCCHFGFVTLPRYFPWCCSL